MCLALLPGSSQALSCRMRGNQGGGLTEKVGLCTQAVKGAPRGSSRRVQPMQQAEEGPAGPASAVLHALMDVSHDGGNGSVAPPPRR
jgi:hypothetical protein